MSVVENGTVMQLDVEFEKEKDLIVDGSFDDSLELDISCIDDIEIEVEFDMSNEMNVEFDNVKDFSLEFEAGILEKGTTDDYRKLRNKPTINGTELYDNYDEIDPTVPEWSKKSKKPDYTPEEIGVGSILFAEIDKMFNQVFS